MEAISYALDVIAFTMEAEFVVFFRLQFRLIGCETLF